MGPSVTAVTDAGIASAAREAPVQITGANIPRISGILAPMRNTFRSLNLRNSAPTAAAFMRPIIMMVETAMAKTPTPKIKLAPVLPSKGWRVRAN